MGTRGAALLLACCALGLAAGCSDYEGTGYSRKSGPVAVITTDPFSLLSLGGIWATDCRASFGGSGFVTDIETLTFTSSPTADQTDERFSDTVCEVVAGNTDNPVEIINLGTEPYVGWYAVSAGLVSAASAPAGMASTGLASKWQMTVPGQAAVKTIAIANDNVVPRLLYVSTSDAPTTAADGYPNQLDAGAPLVETQ
jgi:hypothetical protein